MPRYHRKTAPGVRDGHVRRKNNWKRTADCRNHHGPGPVIDRERPGEGHRHILFRRDVERFVSLLPDWDEAAGGLDVILLAEKRDDCDGWYADGVLAVCAWPTNPVWELDPFWYDDHRPLLDRLGVPVEPDGRGDLIVRWTLPTARAYQLLHVFTHELGHHIDRMTTRARRDNGPRGEGWAEGYAWSYEAAVWERYCREFGVPG